MHTHFRSQIIHIILSFSRGALGLTNIQIDNQPTVQKQNFSLSLNSYIKQLFEQSIYQKIQDSKPQPQCLAKSNPNGNNINIYNGK